MLLGDGEQWMYAGALAWSRQAAGAPGKRR